MIKLNSFKIPKLKILLVFLILLIISLVFLGYFYGSSLQKLSNLTSKIVALMDSETKLKEQVEKIQKEYEELKNQDQVKINQELKSEINSIQNTYKKALDSYESLLDLKAKTSKTQKQDDLLANALSLLSQRKYTQADTKLTELNKLIKDESDKIASSFSIPTNITTSNTPPSSGYKKQQVQVDSANFLVDIVSADLNSTKVIVDTASDSDCRDNCPVLSLADYVARSGAYAGVNGTYFCPASYPSCSGKTNSFDMLVMNKDKKYLNSDNNVYSTLPVAVFSPGSSRFIGQALAWGRDTSVDGVISNHPLLVQGGNIAYVFKDDEKQTSRGSRAFVGASGLTVYIGVVHNVTVAQMAQVLHSLGIKDALNLDSGGSTALWSGGYKVGPGRNIPNAVLLVKR